MNHYINRIWTVLLITLFVLLICKCNNSMKIERFNPDEALQNIASVYNKNDMTVTNLTVTGKSNVVPTGTIVAFYGAAIPAGWALCNGQNGTPDLRGRFIYGYGANLGSTVNARGGAETHQLTVQELPTHNHKIGYLHMRGINHDDSKGEGHTHSNSNTGYQGDSFSEGTGGNVPHNNMPPYHVLAYIMKL